MNRSSSQILLVAALSAFAIACSSGGTPPDSGSPDSGSPDGGTPDAGQPDAGPAGLVCGKLLFCDQACGSNFMCTDGCYLHSTAVAQGLFNALDDCIAATCPSGDGGVCAVSSSTACGNCNQSAATGACVNNLVACEGDKVVGPANNDGGLTVVPDAGQKLNCGTLVACQANCPYDAGTCQADCTAQSTPEAIALEGVLYACLEMACPSTDGGPCATPGLACSGCREQVELAQPNTCAAPYVACNADTSNLPDGGGGPRVLFDGGVITVFVSGLDQAASTLIAHNGSLYYTQVVEGSPVLRSALGSDAGTFSPIGPPQPTPVSVAVDDNNAYVWSVGTFGLNSSTNNHDGTVMQVPLDGGAPITLFTGMEVFYDAAYLNALAVDSKSVYWVSGASGNDGAIMKTAIGASNAAVPLFTSLQIPQAVVTDGVNVYWADWGTFDLNGRSNNDGTVWQGSVDGGTPQLLAHNQQAPSSLVVDSQNVYWVNLGPLGGDNFPAPNSGSVVKTPIGGGALTTIATGQAVPVSIIIDHGTLYWSQYGFSAPGLIMSGPNQGASVVPLVSGLPDPAALAISDGVIYWSNMNSSPTDGSIWSVKLP